MTAHGPDVATFEKATNAELKPHKIDGSLAFMFESRHVFRPTRFAMQAPQLQKNYDAAWGGFRKKFAPK
jgi:homogentisate 1,2-dioxygenase